jgi:hypothetical protein
MHFSFESNIAWYFPMCSGTAMEVPAEVLDSVNASADRVLGDVATLQLFNHERR